jgi:Zn-dependent protease with chaperone function
MKFTPRALPPEAADASRGHDRHPLRELALLVAGIAAICAGLYLVVALVTDAVVMRISPATEARLFGALGNALETPDDLPADLARQQATAERLLTNLLAHAELDGFPVRLRVWDRPETNAFALPGGTIALTPGLLRCVDSEPGLAFVLAHELGHLHARDQLRGLGRQVGFQVVLALLFSSSGDLQFGASQAGQFVHLSHSREREMAADRYALELVLATRGSDAGTAQLFEALGEQGLPGWAHLFSTHPATKERLAALREHAARLRAGPPVKGSAARAGRDA